MFYSDDPVRDYDRYDAEMARREARLPVCDKCDKPIHDDEYYEVEGWTLCEECMKDMYGRRTEDFVNAYD